MNKIVQIAITKGYSDHRLVALRSDGTLWLTDLGVSDEAGKEWYEVALPPGTYKNIPWGVTECSDSST